tara:strand:- start:108 stop:551 length:444 start_codon:yes stop_codon:yes gene_type:complete
MRVLLQRVSTARVETADCDVGAIDNGLLVLFCALEGDSTEDAEYLARKVSKLRIFDDHIGKMNLSVTDTGGKVLVVSQFTLAANTSKGNRPSFIQAAHPNDALPLIERFCDALRQEGLEVETGAFGAEMDVHLVNHGPVTIWLDTRT